MINLLFPPPLASWPKNSESVYRDYHRFKQGQGFESGDCDARVKSLTCNCRSTRFVIVATFGADIMKIKTLVLATAMLLSTLAQPMMAGQLEDAKAAIRGGEYRAGIALLKPLAEQGNSIAQADLGYLYTAGKGVPQDYSVAMKWYRLAAEQGSTKAQFAIGRMYEKGTGVAQDYAQAVRWYKLAANQGDAIAEVALAWIYLEDHPGVPVNNEEARKWFNLAADQGIPVAQNYLGRVYAHGVGVPQDYVKAHMWYNLAAAGTWPPQDGGSAQNKAIADRDELATKMTPDQIAEAQRLAREWLAAHPSSLDPYH